MSGSTFDPLRPADGAWRAAVAWLAGCPMWLPPPRVAVGDDGSVTLEWTQETRQLALAFGGNGTGEVHLSDGSFSASTTDVNVELLAVRKMLMVLLTGNY